MNKTFGILLLLFTFISCGEQQKSLADYEASKVKFARKSFAANNGEYTISLPHNWNINEDPISSDTLLYVMETGSVDTNLTYITIMKMNVIYGSIDNEFDNLLKNTKTRASNVELIENSQLKIGDEMFQTALLSYELNGKIIQEEIDIFIPINESQYYYITLVSDKNEKAERNFGMMISCAKTFKRNK